MEKKGTGKFAIRIWGWPTLIFFISELMLFLVFKVTADDTSSGIIESGSGREVLFETILGCLILAYLWVLVYRYSIVSIKKMPAITKVGVIFLTVLMVLGNFCQWFLYFNR